MAVQETAPAGLSVRQAAFIGVGSMVGAGTSVLAAALAVFFDLSSIASIGSAVALVVFALVTAGHLRIREETGARGWVLWLAIITTVGVLVTFALTTLVDEPATAVTLLVILLLSITVDAVWKHRRDQLLGAR